MAVKHFAQISRDNSKNVSGNCVHFLAIYYDPSRLLIWTFVKSNLVPLVVFFFCQGCLEVRNCSLPALWNLPLLTRAY